MISGPQGGWVKPVAIRRRRRFVEGLEGDMNFSVGRANRETLAHLAGQVLNGEQKYAARDKQRSHPATAVHIFV